jgi:hypothetical protein
VSDQKPQQRPVSDVLALVPHARPWGAERNPATLTPECTLLARHSSAPDLVGPPVQCGIGVGAHRLGKPEVSGSE